jgi:hypothetical protein
MFDFLVLIISKSRVLQCGLHPSVATGVVDAAECRRRLCDLNKLIADTTQFELCVVRSIRVSSRLDRRLVDRIRTRRQQHRPSIDHAACIASRRTNEIAKSTTTNNNNDDDDDNNNDNEDDDEADAAVDEQRLPRLRLVVDLQQLRNWFTASRCNTSSQVARSTEAGRAAAAARAETSAALTGGAGLDARRTPPRATTLARSIRSTPTPRRAPSSLIGREQLDHRRHALDAAANAPLVAAEKLVDKLGLEMDTRAMP